MQNSSVTFSYLLDCFLFPDDTLLKAVAISLNDFSSFDQMSPIAYLLEVLYDLCGLFSVICW